MSHIIDFAALDFLVPLCHLIQMIRSQDNRISILTMFTTQNVIRRAKSRL